MGLSSPLALSYWHWLWLTHNFAKNIQLQLTEHRE